jgi:uncharacterized protein YjbJ (UPF0337 family)
MITTSPGWNGLSNSMHEQVLCETGKKPDPFNCDNIYRHLRHDLPYGSLWTWSEELLRATEAQHFFHVACNTSEILTLVREKWGKLTNNDPSILAGRRDQLFGQIQVRCGIKPIEAEKQLNDCGVWK